MPLKTDTCPTCKAEGEKLRPHPFHKDPELLQCEECRTTNSEYAIIGVTDIKKKYKLKDEDLKGLDVATEAKPKFLGGADRRWYLLKDVEARAEKVLGDRREDLEMLKLAKEEKKKETKGKAEEKKKEVKDKDKADEKKKEVKDKTTVKEKEQANQKSEKPASKKASVEKGSSDSPATEKKEIPAKRKRPAKEAKVQPEVEDDPEVTEDAGTEDETIVEEPKKKKSRPAKPEPAVVKDDKVDDEVPKKKGGRPAKTESAASKKKEVKERTAPTRVSGRSSARPNYTEG